MMGRQHRILYPGAHYHVMARGNRRADLFFRDDDRRLFLSLLAQTCTAYAWRCLSYCLMGNHYHLVLCTERPTLSTGMHFLNGMYARWFNTIHQTTGHVFESRFYPKVIEDDRYLLTAIRYVESNPVHASLCSTAMDWNWSSYHAVVGLRAHGRWFDRAKVLSLFDGDESAAIEQFAEFVGAVVDRDPPWDIEVQTRRQREDAIVEAHLAGVGVGAIARQVGTSRRTVGRVIRSRD